MEVVLRKRKNARRFSPIQKKEMRDLYSEGYALSYIARKFKCLTNAVWNNVFDLSTPMLLSEARIKAALKVCKVTVDDVVAIRKRVKSGTDSWTEATQYGISQTTALGIIRGRTFRWVGGWTRPRAGEPLVFIKPIKNNKSKPLTDKKPGCKKGSKHRMPSGSLLVLAKKYKVSTSTICRRLKNFF
jgi:hypothetical protein